MKNLNKLLLVVIILALILSGCSSSEGDFDRETLIKNTDLGKQEVKKESIKSDKTNDEAKKLVIATGEWAPYTSENLENYGFNTEIITKAFEVKGYEVEYKFEKWSRCVELTKSGEVFGTFPWGKTEDRKEFFIWSDIVSFGDEVLWYMEGTPGIPDDFKGFDSVRSLKHGGVAAYSYLAKYKDNNIPIEEAPAEKEALKKLFNGRVDIMPGTLLTTLALIEETYPNDKDRFKYLKTPLMSNDMALMILKDNPDNKEVLEDFNKGLKEIYTNGTLEEILEKHDLGLLLDGYSRVIEDME